MATKKQKHGAIPEFFRKLGIASAEEREHLRRLAELGQVRNDRDARRYAPADTRDNTALEKSRA